MIRSADSLASLLPVATLIVKLTVMAWLALLAGRLGAHLSAARRHLLYVSAVVVCLALPMATWSMRPVQMPIVPVVARHVAPATDDEPTSPSALSEDIVAQKDVAPAAFSAPDTHRVVQLASTSLVTMWLVGVAVCLLRMFAGACEVRRLRRGGEVWSDGQARAEAVAASAGIRRRVIVRCHNALPGPIAVGVWRPALIMPTGARDWSEKQMQRALIHELEHIRRLDAFSQLLARVACALYWFHPLVWRIARHLRIEAERACDDAVLRDDDPAEYASLLVDVATVHSESNSGHAMIAMAHRADLAVRVAAILDGRQSRQPARRPWVVTAVCAALCSTALLAPLTLVARTPQARAARFSNTTASAQADTGVFTVSHERASLPAIASACGQSMSSPAAQPPDGSLPVLLSLEGCFGARGPTRFPRQPVDVYMSAIRLPRLVSKPSMGKWTLFTPDVERTIQEDIARTTQIEGVEKASAEVNSYVFPNGVIGKTIVYRVVERDQRSAGAAAQVPQGTEPSSQSRFARTDLVLVDVVVKDAQGQIVEGLRAEDFRVREDGVERAVELFEYRSTPSGSYYLLGFRQANTVVDGKFRRISVQVNRPGVHVESRQGYYASRDDFSRDAYAEDMPGVVAPLVRERREAVYPSEAVAARIQGNVVVEAVVGVDGRVTRARVNPPFDAKYGLDDAAVHAVEAWTFTPGEFNGNKVPVLTRVVVGFWLH